MTGFRQRRVEERRLCLLYDPSDGAIVHAHMVTTLEGGRGVDDDEMERRVRERAGVRAAGRLAVLHVDPATFRTAGRYRVEGGALIEIERPRRP
jgi:hypothetical protein